MPSPFLSDLSNPRKTDGALTEDGESAAAAAAPAATAESESIGLPPVRVPMRADPRSTAFHGLSSSRSRPGSPRSSPTWSARESGPTRFSAPYKSRRRSRSGFSDLVSEVLDLLRGQKQVQTVQSRPPKMVKGRGYGKRAKGFLALMGLVLLYLFVNWRMLLSIQYDSARNGGGFNSANSSSIQVKLREIDKGQRQQNVLYRRLLSLATRALGEKKPEPKDLWLEPLVSASAWRPCADQHNWKPSAGSNGYIMVSANGGINQQRVAVCNAVVIARLLNSTLVVPRFLYSSVWKDESQFNNIYQEDHFIDYLKPDIRIVKELPKELQSLDFGAIGSVVTDENITKEASFNFYLKIILPILHRNRVVHFFGFGNRLAFDPIPFDLQRLRCRCNFHALKFVPKIEETGALLLKRMRKNATHSGLLDRHLVGPFEESTKQTRKGGAAKSTRYLSLHLRFEIDMVAHSLCEFGGGEDERRELEAYREAHFPALALLKKAANVPSPEALRSEGLCPLTPEEAALMLAALGFSRKTNIYLAGADIYGGSSKLGVLTRLYPNLVTKDKLLSQSEIEPFLNFSSQLAALDFIVCGAADAFAMTDPGSQFSALVSGYRVYHGRGRMPTIRPNKRRLADILLKNSSIGWKVFEQRVRKSVRQTKRARTRPLSRSVYRFPRCEECMCFTG